MFRRIVTTVLVSVLSAPVAFAQSKPKTDAASAAIARDANGKLTIDGSSGSITGCTGGRYYTVHPIGTVNAGTRIRVNFTTADAIDPVAALVILQMGAGVPNNVRANSAYDDDSGGGRDPRLDVTAEYNGSVVLSVGSFDGTFGCYVAKVEIS